MRKTTSRKTWAILIILVFSGTSVLFAGGQKQKTKADPYIRRLEWALEKTKKNRTKVWANDRAIAHKASNTFSVAFPDVCKTPTTGGPIPIPYPNFSKSSDTSNSSKKVKLDQAVSMAKKSDYKKSESDEAGTRMRKLQKRYKKIDAKRNLTVKEKTAFKKELKLCLDKSRSLTKILDRYVEEIESLLEQAKKQL
jgi:hypothetical protein